MKRSSSAYVVVSVVSVITVATYLFFTSGFPFFGSWEDAGYPFRYSIYGPPCAPTAGFHCTRSFDFTLAALDYFFWLAVVLTPILILGILSGRIDLRNKNR
jgi:hypothetical protein